ncbi:MAG: N-acetylglucosamine-6-phosphate deacetylase [Lachnospiraceae bacterium]|nr:N-acetylglucosamine-6-phosphate deacetylase [Lachnospiraceae bacterium]
MRYINAFIYRGREEGFSHGGFETKDGLFSSLFFYPENEKEAPGGGDDCMDLEGAYVIPGLIDVHIHGSMGADFSDAGKEDLIKMGEYLLLHGITSFAPASMTFPLEKLARAYRLAAEIHDKDPENCSRLAGIYMEGPFLSNKRRGAQNPKYLKAPDISLFKELYDISGGLIRIATIAPELRGALEYIKYVSDICTVSVAHTDASYEQGRAAFDAGARQLTHLYNAMSPLHHRNPGVIGAGAERDDIRAELICDGIHVHPSMVRLSFKLFPGRVCLISDASECTGMPDGVYELGGQAVYLKGRRVTLEDGTIAASASDLYDCMLKAISFGIPVKEAVYSATLVPAKAVGCDDKAGSIEEGKWADFVICDKELNRIQVFKEGKRY